MLRKVLGLALLAPCALLLGVDLLYGGWGPGGCPTVGGGSFGGGYWPPAHRVIRPAPHVAPPDPVVPYVRRPVAPDARAKALPRPRKVTPLEEGGGETKPLCGVQRDMMPEWGGAHYSIKGVPCTKWQALEYVGSKSVPDDATHLRITVICDDRAKREAIVAEVRALPSVKGKATVQGYGTSSPKADWAVLRFGHVLPKDGGVMINVETAAGKELTRQMHYDGGAAGFEVALHKADPNYKPDLTPDKSKPDPVKPKPDPTPDPQPSPLTGVPTWAYLLGGAGALVLLLKKKS